MHIHILGISGTFMAGIAAIAREAGHIVTGCDLNIYPPMSTQLAELGIEVCQGYDPSPVLAKVDCVIVGNVIRRGNPSMEYVMEKNIPFYSGPEWLAKHVLKDRCVLAVSGTHGKTTTTSLLAWILEYADHHPGFLIGGVPPNFGISARLGHSPYFVIEADEYDSAFFDKRSKFIHYRPKVLILNNLEFDHADIFPDLAAIKREFHHLIRTVPGNGLIIRHAPDPNLQAVLDQGVWTPVVTFDGKNATYQAECLAADGSHFKVIKNNDTMGEVQWNLLGQHNVNNALAAFAAAEYAGVPIATACKALALFKNVKRRLEVRGIKDDIVVYDDFAHHPTAIDTTLKGLRAKVGKARIVAVIEFGSYTMRTGVHKSTIKEALRTADAVFCKRPKEDWGLELILKTFSQPTALFDDVDTFIAKLVPELKAGDHVVCMSNASFDGIHQKLLNAIA